MKSRKKKLVLPRRRWAINPVTRVQQSARRYARPRAKAELRKQAE